MIDQGLVDELAAAEYLAPSAITRAVLNPDSIAAPVLALLDAAARGETLTLQQENLLFWGIHILACARDTRGFRSLMRLLNQPHDDLDRLLGDAITATLPRVVAGMFDGTADLLFDAAKNAAIDQFVRNSILRAVAFLTWEGRIELPRTQAFLERFDEERTAEPEDFAWDGWQEAVALLGLRTLAPRVSAAFRDGRMDPLWGSEKHFDETLREAEQAPRESRRFAKSQLGHIEDVLDELGWLKAAPADAATRQPEESWFRPQPPTINLMRHVGRNDPCPCGSGKKAKRCCLAA